MNELTMIYDSDCGFCKGWVDWIQKRDNHHRIEFLPCRSQQRIERFPKIEEADCLKAMYVVLPDGNFFSGADAAPYLLKALPKWKWASMLFKIPGVLLVARPIYRWIARRRHRLGCDSNHCQIRG